MGKERNEEYSLCAVYLGELQSLTHARIKQLRSPQYAL